MSFGAFNHHRQNGPMADINVTPMVDVMLVLLVIFILGAPMLTSTVQLELPKAAAQAQAAPPAPPAIVTVAIDARGQVFWNNAAVTPKVLEQRLAEAAKADIEPELQLRADKDTRYEAVAQLMAAAQAHGLTKLGFVTDPRKVENK